MESDDSLSSLRRKRVSERATLWLAYTLVAFFRVLFRGLELFGPRQRRQRLRQFREKMDAINQDRDAVISQIHKGDVLGSLETIEERWGRHADPDIRADLQEASAQIRATKQESETLRDIARRAGDDQALAVENYREYVQEHPESHRGFSYLGGALRKAGDLDGSLAAYREAIRLAGEDTIPGNSARLQLGEVLREKGDIEAAISEFQRIIENVSPQTELYVSLAFLSLGETFNSTGERAKARDAWKQAIQWDPTKVVAKKARQMLAANP